MRSSFPSFRPFLAACLLLAAIVPLLAGCGSGIVGLGPAVYPAVISNSPTSVSVPTVQSEDLAGPCNFDLWVSPTTVVVEGTLVVFERGDSHKVYADTSLRNLASQLNYAMVWAAECNAKSTGDLQADASQGPARTLVAATAQFAVNANHPELKTGGMVLYGFSAAGVLSVTMKNVVPERIIGAIEFASGDEYLYLPTLTITPAAAQIPTLILDNAEDLNVGTTMGLQYFQRGRAMNAPWAYGVQHATKHCCNASTLPLIKPWLSALAAVQVSNPSPSQGLTQSRYSNAQFAWFTCSANSVVDNLGFDNCAFSASTVGAQAPSLGEVGWLPDSATASAWSDWVTNPVTN